eukprot:CAMPEP_0182504688 /NCGR_PEP_ID=MMETSP1321-20130603/17698_1 /TAXON_ID=91990 /ORGANISM="Bolidomonas sp., Strain RCC1657" /LENGTH=65 /DNA_ID=CAMNT_0024710089 /DNA_START=94 /DNA_END=288 /DNA_ORIENTATION=-
MAGRYTSLVFDPTESNATPIVMSDDESAPPDVTDKWNDELVTGRQEVAEEDASKHDIDVRWHPCD